MISAIVLLAQAATVPAADMPTSPAEVFASIEGSWEGAIEYRDYQSNTLQSIPMKAEMENRPDGVTMVQRYQFADPRSAVYSTNLIAFAGDTLSIASARAGRPFETYTQTVEVASVSAPDNWTLTMSQTGKDANRPAAIRETVLRDGNQMTITKEIDFLDDDVTQWEFRNRVTLNRVS